MKKRLLATVLALIMVLGMLPGTVWAAETASGTCGENATWSLSGGTLTISGSGPMEDYDYYYPLPPWWGHREDPITSVVIGSGITSIGDVAFAGCSALTSITILGSVTQIGNNAFSGCSGLANITIPSSVTSIGIEAFDGCSDLTNITIPSSVTSIGSKAFDGCSGLTSISIPDGITSIEGGTFADCSRLTSIAIPDSVVSIGGAAFAGCSGLINIDLPDGVTSIGDGAFGRCSGLTNITIPDGVTSIGFSTFEGCSSLTNINLPDGITSIGFRAFTDCSSLINVTIPSGVTLIDLGTFSGCSSLKSVTVPYGVTSIGRASFSGCSSLTSITIPSSVTYIAMASFSGCSGLKSITIPSSITAIEYNVFENCSSLTNITIPSSVTSIGDHAFRNCNNLTDVYFLGSEDQWKSVRKNEGNNIPLRSATIHYNSTGPDQPTPPTPEEPKGDITFAKVPPYTLKAGEEISITAYIPDTEELQKEDVTWNIDNKAIATIDRETILNVSNTFTVVITIKGISEGSTRLSISTADGRTNSCQIIVESDADAYGTCGVQEDNLVWRIKDGVLTISGTGDMKDYESDAAEDDAQSPWKKYAKDITTVLVEDGVTGIGSYAFTYLFNCETITLGKNINSVRSYGIDVRKNNGACVKISFEGNAPAFLDTHFLAGEKFPVELYYDNTRDIDNWNRIVNRKYVQNSEEQLANIFWIPIQNKPRELPVRQTFSFTNDDPYFVRTRENGEYITADGYYITSKDYDKLIKAVPNNEKGNLKKEKVGDKNVKAFNVDGKDAAGKVVSWGGSCYGMSAIVAAVINGAISPSELGITSSDIELGVTANDLHSVGNSNNQLISESIRSFINFYHYQQKLADVKKQKYAFGEMDQKDQIKALRQLVEIAEKDGRVVLIDFGTINNGEKVSHTIVGYAVQYGRFSLTVGGGSQVYYGRILVYDPKDPGDSQSSNSAIYFNDTTFAIPYWGIYSPERGIDKVAGNTGTLTGVLSLDDYINAIDYKTGNLSYKPDSRSASTLAYLYTGNQDLDLTVNSHTEEIRDGLFGGTRTISDSGAMILFPSSGEGGSTSYTVVLPVEGEYRIDATEQFSCSVLTDNLYMDVTAIAAGTASFDPVGKVELNSESPTTAYLSLTANDGYHTLPWHTIEANGEGASVLSLELTDDGVVVAGDNLTDTIITGIQSDEDEETVSISTDKDSVLITEKDEKFEILIDVDNDGEYETPIETTPVLPTPTSYTVTFNANGGTVTPATMDTNEIGKLTSLPTPARTGYSFNGWYTAPSGGTRITTDSVFTENTTVYAHWTYVGGNGGGTIGGGSSSGSSSSGGSSGSNTISIPIVAGGKISVNPKTAVKGTTVTITVTPDRGYELEGITVKDSRGNTLELTDKGGGKYTFKMPDCAIAVSAVFKQIDDSSATTTVSDWVNPFTDVAANAWYYDAVKFVCEGGLMNGISSTQFAPDANLSRAQLAQILYNKEGKPAVSGNSIFTDVTASAWYSNAVIWAAANNIVSGYGNALFGPDDNITREQLAVMLWRYSGSPAVANKELQFNDADQISDYALDALLWAVENGIINGKGNGILDPKGLATRAQVAQMLKNYMER